MRKWLRIALFVAIGLFLLAAVAVFSIWKASRHVPDFYRQAVRLDPATMAEDSDEMIQAVTSLTSDVKHEGDWEATFTAEEINGWLAVDLVGNHSDRLPPAISDPRVVIEPNHLKLACRFNQGYIDTVFSLETDVYLSDPNVVAIRIRKARAGALPLPLDQLLRRVDAAAQRSRLGIKWRQADGDPVAYISLPSSDNQKETIEVKTLELREGEIYLAGSTERR